MQELDDILSEPVELPYTDEELNQIVSDNQIDDELTADDLDELMSELPEPEPLDDDLENLLSDLS